MAGPPVRGPPTLAPTSKLWRRLQRRLVSRFEAAGNEVLCILQGCWPALTEAVERLVVEAAVSLRELVQSAVQRYRSAPATLDRGGASVAGPSLGRPRPLGSGQRRPTSTIRRTSPPLLTSEDPAHQDPRQDPGQEEVGSSAQSLVPGVFGGGGLMLGRGGFRERAWQVTAIEKGRRLSRPRRFAPVGPGRRRGVGGGRRREGGGLPHAGVDDAGVEDVGVQSL